MYFFGVSSRSVVVVAVVVGDVVVVVIGVDVVEVLGVVVVGAVQVWDLPPVEL